MVDYDRPMRELSLEEMLMFKKHIYLQFPGLLIKNQLHEEAKNIFFMRQVHASLNKNQFVRALFYTFCLPESDQRMILRLILEKNSSVFTLSIPR